MIMQYKIIKIVLVSIIVFWNTGIHAQQAATSSGGDASGTGGSAAYSVGQALYKTDIGPDGSSAQGVQQPYEVFIYESVEGSDDITLTMAVYPNPVKDELTLKISDRDISGMQYRIIDIYGKEIENKEITGDITNIDFSKLLPSAYFVKIISDEKEIKTFKIVKN
jgi:hypothetical protein